MSKMAYVGIEQIREFPKLCSVSVKFILPLVSKGCEASSVL